MHRRGGDEQPGAEPENGKMAKQRHFPSVLYHRLFRGPFGQGERKSRAAPVHVPYDLSSPFGPGDGAGADLPGFFHRRRKQISQIIIPLFLVFFREEGDFLHLIHFIEKNDWKAYALFDIII